MSKRVPLSPKPARVPKTELSVDHWIQNRHTDKAIKRLTIDLSPDLHAKIKATCAMRGKKMADEIRELLEEKYGKSQIQK